MLMRLAFLSILIFANTDALAMDYSPEESGQRNDMQPNNGDLEAGLDHHHDGDGEEAGRICACSLVRVWQTARAGCEMSWQLLGRMLAGLGTPKGAIIVTCLFGISTGISNFLWAFNWKEHAGASDEAHAIVQEIGGLTASAEAFLFGVLVPVMIYQYNKHANAEQ